jgi:hypothetical protein
MAVSEQNRIRYRAIQVSRQVKWIFMAPPERLARWLAGKLLFGMLLRWLFNGPDGKPHVAGEIVLAELRNRYALGSVFSDDPLVMARKVGRREVFDDLIFYLNLDEGTVQRLMELDDGLD